MPNMDSKRRSESKNGSRSAPPLWVLKSWAEKPQSSSTVNTTVQMLIGTLPYFLLTVQSLEVLCSLLTDHWNTYINLKSKASCWQRREYHRSQYIFSEIILSPLSHSSSMGFLKVCSNAGCKSTRVLVGSISNFWFSELKQPRTLIWLIVLKCIPNRNNLHVSIVYMSLCCMYLFYLNISSMLSYLDIDRFIYTTQRFLCVK